MPLFRKFVYSSGKVAFINGYNGWNYLIWIWLKGEELITSSSDPLES